MREIKAFESERREWQLERDELRSTSSSLHDETVRMEEEIRRLAEELGQLRSADSARLGPRSEATEGLAAVVVRLGEENRRLREDLNEEKQKVLDMKRADHAKRLAWKSEMLEVERELDEKVELEESLARAREEVRMLKARHQSEAPGPREGKASGGRSLREMVCLFLGHAQEPLLVFCEACAKTRAAHGSTRPSPSCPRPVAATEGDDSCVEQLVLVLDLLRCSAQALIGFQTAGAAYGLGEQEQEEVPGRARYGCTAVSQAGGAQVFARSLDETTSRVTDWFVSKLPS